MFNNNEQLKSFNKKRIAALKKLESDCLKSGVVLQSVMTKKELKDKFGYDS